MTEEQIINLQAEYIKSDLDVDSFMLFRGVGGIKLRRDLEAVHEKKEEKDGFKEAHQRRCFN